MRPQNVKTVRVDLKAAGDGEASQDGSAFVGYAAIFGNVDSYGDVVVAGAFTDTLRDDWDGGKGIPCYWGHRMDDPGMCVGEVVEALEDDRGLKVRVELDVDDNPAAAAVNRLVKRRLVRQMSFAFDVVDGGWGERDGREVFELKQLRLHEVSVVPVGANQDTELEAAKARRTPAKSSDPDGSEPAERQESGGAPAVALANAILKSF